MTSAALDSPKRTGRHGLNQLHSRKWFSSATASLGTGTQTSSSITIFHSVWVEAMPCQLYREVGQPETAAQIDKLAELTEKLEKLQAQSSPKAEKA